jgi:predicted esterase
VEEHHITVPRTARYHTLGVAATARELWMVLHGYGQLARFFLRPFEGLEEHRLIAAPEGLSRFYTDEAHSRVGATWMTREDREAEIRDQATYLDALAEHLRAQCPPNTPLHVLGFSQGVATACRWAATTTVPIKSLVLWAGSMPPELEPSRLRDHWRTLHVMLVHGEQDKLVSPEIAAQSAIRLRDAGIAHKVEAFQGGHVLDRLTLQMVLDGTPHH